MIELNERLGVQRRINSAGTLTHLGGSLMEPEVLQAMNQAAGASVDIAELQAAASRVIEAATGAQAGIVTSGAAAGMTVGSAACLARWDVARMAALPDTRAMPNRGPDGPHAPKQLRPCRPSGRGADRGHRAQLATPATSRSSPKLQSTGMWSAK
jgi:hypothetical protein